MSNIIPLTPSAPDWRVEWDALVAEFPCLETLAGCPQDPIYHAEGDVWIHTRMVCEAMASLPAWRALGERDREVLFASALFHDIAKPECTKTEPNGRITSRGHSRRGAVLTRGMLWKRDVPFAFRESVCALIRYHQIPYHLLDRHDPLRMAIEVSQTARADHLAILAEADVRGRICEDQQRLLDNVTLFTEFCREEGCLDGPRAFASDHARFLYFQTEGRYPDAPAHEDFVADVVMLSGLPGSGKDHWVTTNLPEWPRVALDEVRAELGISPEDDQGAVLNHARDLARDYLRSGTDFVWNATNLSRQLRGGVVSLFAAYRARVKLVYVEVPYATLFSQNASRSAKVPEKVMHRLIDRWEIPDPTEAHVVEHCVREADGL